MKEINNSIVKSYCSFEVSKLLKEKGLKFPLTSEGYYWEKSGSRIAPYGWFTPEELADYIDAPTHALAVEWLRINFGIWIEIRHIKTFEINRFYIIIWNYRDPSDYITFFCENGVGYKVWDSPQEATEAALKYVLEELI